MKKVISIITLSVILFACGRNKKKSVEETIATNNLKEIRAKKTEINALHTTYTKQLEQLNAKISELDSNKKIASISTLPIKDTLFKHYIELQGNVSTNNLVVIYPEFPGILITVYVKEGQQVSKGQQLAKIDDGGLTPQLAQMQIQASLAKTTFERQERLWNQKIGSEIQYLQAKTNYEAQTKMIAQLRKQIAKTVVKAPFAGTIDEVITKQGNMVSPGATPLIRIVNLNEMHVKINVPEKYISNVVKEGSVEVEIPVLGKTIQTKISQVGSFINPANRTFKIEVPVPNDDKTIKPNLTAKIKINDYSNQKALLIPQSIISENAAGEQYIYIVINKKNNTGIAKKAIITTGKTQGNFVEVLSGIESGAEIIQEGARSIQDGQEVQILNKK